MSRLEVQRWQTRAADLYDVLAEVVNAGGLTQLPVPVRTRALDALTGYAVDCHLTEGDTDENK